MRSILNRRGAIELSMTTVVVIVLSMTMLALGLTLVRTLFQGAQDTAGSLNSNVKNEINKIFSNQETKVAIISEQNLLAPQRNADNCIWWQMVADVPEKYSYEFTIDPAECGGANYRLSTATLTSWFLSSLKGSFNLGANEIKPVCLRIHVPSSAPSCLFSLNLEVKNAAGVTFGTSSVDVRPKASSLFG
jgi:hypothetical protein